MIYCFNNIWTIACLFPGYVRPSQELLEFYRTKFMEYDKEYDNLVKKLDKYHSAYEQVVSCTDL